MTATLPWACFIGGGSERVRITGGGSFYGVFLARDGQLGLRGLTLSGNNGAAATGTAGQLAVEGVTFNGGVVGGGALDVRDGGRAAASNCLFAGASSGNNPGAAVWAGHFLTQDRASVALHECTFRGNTAAYGPAIYLDRADGELTGRTLLEGNSVTLYGGVVDAGAGSTLAVRGSVCAQGNVAPAGAVFGVAATATVSFADPDSVRVGGNAALGAVGIEAGATVSCGGGPAWDSSNGQFFDVSGSLTCACAAATAGEPYAGNTTACGGTCPGGGWDASSCSCKARQCSNLGQGCCDNLGNIQPAGFMCRRPGPCAAATRCNGVSADCKIFAVPHGRPCGIDTSAARVVQHSQRGGHAAWSPAAATPLVATPASLHARPPTQHEASDYQDGADECAGVCDGHGACVLEARGPSCCSTSNRRRQAPYHRDHRAPRPPTRAAYSRGRMHARLSAHAAAGNEAGELHLLRAPSAGVLHAAAAQHSRPAGSEYADDEAEGPELVCWG